ncbi:MAG: metallopeptidase TldD-related protein, partial [Myxococcota bacterium]
PRLLGQLASCLSGYSVYRKSSFLADRMGHQVASNAITIIDDGRLPQGLGSKPFDGEGLATRRNVLVHDGVLESWLLDSYSARKLGLNSTGNASRGASSGPGVSPTNLWIEPGQGSLDDLIEDTGQGLLVTDLMGMGFNPTTGDYSQGARGFWIEEGELAFPVEEITIASNLGTMLTDIDAVGEELIWRGRTAAPPLRVHRMTIAGA